MSAYNASRMSTTFRDATNVSTLTIKDSVLVSDEVRVILNWILYGFLLLIVCSFGIVSNIINIICFVRQGLKDPVNVSVLGLAISDLGSLVTSLCVSICYNPALQILDLPVEMADVVYITFAPPHFLFAGVSSWITALITLERCLCITKPVKVKSMVTARRVTVVIVVIFLLFSCTVSTMFFIGQLSWVFSPDRNRTVLKLVYADHRDTVEQFSFYVNNGLIPFSAYIMIIICTLTLVGELLEKARWRKTSAASVNVDKISKRDQKVAKMVMAISVVFIVCFSPTCASAVSIAVLPELAVDGPNQNLLYVFGGVFLFLESANSSANIFIYYSMSSRYRVTFRHLFSWR